ncbi:MAG: DNA translocase FtsK, partial [Acidobacteriota bacterium]
MNDLTAAPRSRRSELAGFLFLILGLLMWLSLLSYNPGDPSWNTATGASPRNLIGPAGSLLSDLFFQAFGVWSLSLPVVLLMLAWNRVRTGRMGPLMLRLAGFALLVLSGCTAFELGPKWLLYGDIPSGGLAGTLLAELLISLLNTTGAAIVTGACAVVALYLLSSFSLLAAFRGSAGRWRVWRASRGPAIPLEPEPAARVIREAPPVVVEEPPIAPPLEPVVKEIPIRTLDDLPPEPKLAPAAPEARPERAAQRARRQYALPSTELLNEPAGRNAYDEQELKETAARIESKFREFGVLGAVVQINPGPVVTTFEFKPEAGIKYSRITTLTEDLCLGLQAESILIERIPGRPTVGIEVPNSKRELIGLRQVLESEEFSRGPSRLTVPLGKDISGRIKVASLESMPHLLIAGSTGSGKSVMLNSLIMSVLFKSTPDEVRMILVDPKRLELGLYEGIPHLLTPVITDPRKATNALRNAVLEMERRLRLLASQSVRNVEQFNRKVRRLEHQPISLFEEERELEDLEPLPHVLVVIDELADLMMVERQNVEQSVTRLAQMARAVGMHLVLATQRPSVDVVTGLIKANFPARISFRVATRVDSRTVLDVMGAEHLLGKGDMLFLPPGSSRLTRVHGPLVTESEINRVVEFWKAQADPDYDESFLIAPPSEEEEGAEGEEISGEQDPLYREAVRVVLEMGKASTSTLQRRLRLGYGRAARILDVMQREGIIGPPDGSKPRDVLKRPEWLDE